MANEQNLIPAKKGEIRNPKGKPKGTKHLSTWIQELLNDEEFETVITDAKRGVVEYKGAPLKAILAAQIQMALHSRDETTRLKAFDLLGKYGYGSKQEVDVTTNGNDITSPVDQNMLTQFLMSVNKDTKR